MKNSKPNCPLHWQGKGHSRNN